jgi:putative membrane protein
MMSISRALIALVAVEHLYILTLEMFLWRTRGLKVFGMTPEFAETTAVLAKNQGLYNGFLAAGLSGRCRPPIFQRGPRSFSAA